MLFAMTAPQYSKYLKGVVQVLSKADDVQDPCVLEMNCFLSVRLSTRDAQDESFDLLQKLPNSF